MHHNAALSPLPPTLHLLTVLSVLWATVYSRIHVNITFTYLMSISASYATRRFLEWAQVWERMGASSPWGYWLGGVQKSPPPFCLPQGDLSLANGTKPCIHCDLPLDCTLFWALCSTEETPQHIPQRELLCVVIRIKCKSLEYSPRAVTAVQNSDVT